MLVVGCPVLSPTGLCLCTAILVHQALPAQNSPCHVEPTHTMAVSHVESGGT